MYIQSDKYKYNSGIGAVVLIAMLILSLPTYAYRIHCEEDTIKISNLLRLTAENGGNLGERCVFVARQLADSPLSKSPDNDAEGTVVLDMHGFDRMGFVNNVIAIAQTSMKKLPTVKEFGFALEGLSRRKGIDEGFASKLLYGADWIVDNVYRGNLKEMTEYLTGGGFKTKTLDYVSHHKDEFPALQDSVVYDKIKMMEMGYRSHRIPHLKKQSAGNKPLHELMQNGDIIMMLSPEIDYDVYDIGIVQMKNGEPYLIHISYETDKVVEDPYPLSRLFKIEGQHFYGYRWLRPEE